MDRSGTRRVVAVINGKGGVGKTSITANVAGQLGRGNLRVLVVDVDPSGGLKTDLGWVDQPGQDNGRGLMMAISMDLDLQPVRDVREGVDYVPGGHHLEVLSALAQTNAASDLPGGGVGAAFAQKLASIADEYDLVLVDCPPGDRALQAMALQAARWVIIPTKTDPGSWEGFRGVGPQVRKARDTNPDLDYLGVVLFAHTSNASRVGAQTRSELAEAGIPLFDAYISHTESGAHDARVRGQLAHEVARDAQVAKEKTLAALHSARARVKTGARGGKAARSNVVPLPARFTDTTKLAKDYHALASEIVTRIAAAEADAAVPTARKTAKAAASKASASKSSTSRAPARRAPGSRATVSKASAKRGKR